MQNGRSPGTCAVAWRRVAAFGAVATMVAVAPRPVASQLPGSSLSVRTPAGWSSWWRAERAPAVWRAALPRVAGAVRWRAVRPGVESGRLDLTGDGVAWRISLVLARVDPAKVRFQLDTAVTDDWMPAWTIERANSAVLAVNAGQFVGGTPWGWLVRRGRELQPPGRGPLASAVVVDSGGRVALLDAGELGAARSGGRVVEAFQSYPAILVGDGEVPAALRAPGRGVDLVHRDSRLAVCILRDGRVLFALTRFMAPGSPLARLPFGPTTPEMAAIMGALGCRRALLLDGGLSGQLQVHAAGGRVLRWPGLRAVPVGLLAYARESARPPAGRAVSRRVARAGARP